MLHHCIQLGQQDRRGEIIDWLSTCCVRDGFLVFLRRLGGEHRRCQLTVHNIDENVGGANWVARDAA